MPGYKLRIPEDIECLEGFSFGTCAKQQILYHRETCECCPLETGEAMGLILVDIILTFAIVVISILIAIIVVIVNIVMIIMIMMMMMRIIMDTRSRTTMPNTTTTSMTTTSSPMIVMLMRATKAGLMSTVAM